MLGIFFLEIVQIFVFPSNGNKMMPDSRVMKRYVRVTLGMEMPCLNMLKLVSFQRHTSLQEQVALPYEKCSKGLHIIIGPDLLAILVIFIRNVLVF